MAAPISADTTDIFNRHLKAIAFDSWDEFETALLGFEKETNSVFRKKNSHNADNANKNRRDPIPDRFKYSSVRYTCQHFGAPRKRGTGRRNHTRYTGVECPAFFVVSYYHGCLRISRSFMGHANHRLVQQEDRKQKRLHCEIVRPITISSTSPSPACSENDPRLQTFYSQFTDTAVELMKNNHSHLSECIHTGLTDSSSLVSLHAAHFVVNHDSGECICKFRRDYDLPCVHAVCLMLQDVMSSELITLNSKFLKPMPIATPKALIAIEPPPPVVNVPTASATSPTPPLTAAEQWRMAADLTFRMNLQLSRMSDENFEKRITFLDSLISSWEKEEQNATSTGDVVDTGAEERMAGASHWDDKTEVTIKSEPVEEVVGYERGQQSIQPAQADQAHFMHMRRNDESLLVRKGICVYSNTKRKFDGPSQAKRKKC